MKRLELGRCLENLLGSPLEFFFLHVKQESQQMSITTRWERSRDYPSLLLSSDDFLTLEDG